MSHHTQYYNDQVGGRIARVYTGTPHQRGHGIGSFLGGLYRTVLPLFKSGLKAIGKESLRSGFNVLDDVTNNNMNFREAFKKRSGESLANLKRKAEEKIDRVMSGSGYKKRRITKKRQSGKKRPVNKTKARVIRKKRRKQFRRKGVIFLTLNNGILTYSFPRGCQVRIGFLYSSSHANVN